MPNEDAKNIDWARVYPQAVAAAAKLRAREAQEIVQEGIKLFLEGEAPFDAASGKTFATHLAKVGFDAQRYRQRTEERRWAPIVKNTLKAFLNPRPATPEARYSEAEIRHRKTLRLERFIEEHKTEDPEAYKVLVLEQQGVRDPPEQAAQSGLSLDRVRQARKRIARRLAARKEGWDES